MRTRWSMVIVPAVATFTRIHSLCLLASHCQVRDRNSKKSRNAPVRLYIVQLPGEKTAFPRNPFTRRSVSQFRDNIFKKSKDAHYSALCSWTDVASISKKSNPLSVPVSWSETTIFQKNLNNVAFSIKLIAFSLTYHEPIYIH